MEESARFGATCFSDEKPTWRFSSSGYEILKPRSAEMVKCLQLQGTSTKPMVWTVCVVLMWLLIKDPFCHGPAHPLSHTPLLWPVITYLCYQCVVEACPAKELCKGACRKPGNCYKHVSPKWSPQPVTNLLFFIE